MACASQQNYWHCCLTPPWKISQKKNQFVPVGNKHVFETIKKYRKRKRGNFGHFTPESRAKIAKWACEYGYTSAAKRFSKELMRDVNDSTVRLIKNQYLRELKNSENGNCTSLHEASRRRPPLGIIRHWSRWLYKKKLRNVRSVVNRHILIAGAKGIVEYKNRSLQSENERPIESDRSWAESFLRRFRLFKMKRNKSSQKTAHGFLRTEVGVFVFWKDNHKWS